MHWQFYCSWPVGALNPNSRCHWAIKARARKEQRTESYLLACRHIPSEARHRLKDADRLTVKLQFVRPNRGPRDIDNMIASSKGLIDGIADATGINDSKFKLEFDMDEPPCRPGGVRVTVSESIEARTGVASAQASP
jgi:crossover junction endodeoxyribonuclease RusA